MGRGKTHFPDNCEAARVKLVTEYSREEDTFCATLVDVSQRASVCGTVHCLFLTGLYLSAARS
jgi:hypothetical protein